ncbi:MAG: hypothetical protein H2050_14445 [Sphingobium sp.]|uniref:hypothetical protein n=1 Tax=Sphingomonadales TaxID=204457 RepID=UPI0017CE2D6A|nr:MULTISPECIES: hypothetical protein [Sphingomonadaceae]MBA4756024.1 hypothetical protein [Sphingobium sp.]QUM71830.1 hypothetical protein ICN83_16115 [Sphingopyxis granuli]
MKPSGYVARLAALSAWQAEHDPRHEGFSAAVIDAVARFSPNESGHAFGFGPADFQELILFIEELPW